MNTYKTLGAIIAILMYFPLLHGIWTNKIKQPFAMWLLWGLLDGITLLSVIVQGGNWLLLAIYTTASCIVMGSMLFKKQFGWTNFETLVTILVICCIIVWTLSGPKVATIAGTLAIVIATFPQFKNGWKDPKSNPWLIWLGFALANGLSTMGGAAWSIEERFYAFTCTLLCLAIAGINLVRK